jgi:hypothetical protein
VQLNSVLAAIEKELRIEWTYAADPLAAQGAAQRAPEGAGALPSDIAQELLHLARLGDVQALARRVRDLPLLNPRLREFSEMLAVFIRSYDLKSVREILSRSETASA